MALGLVVQCLFTVLPVLGSNTNEKTAFKAMTATRYHREVELAATIRMGTNRLGRITARVGEAKSELRSKMLRIPRKLSCASR